MKRIRPGGKQRKITKDVVLAVATEFARGIPLKNACALQDPPFSESHFQKALDMHPTFELAFEKVVGEACRDRLNKISTGDKGWQALAWILERRFGFVTKTAPQVSVNVQTLVGMNEDIRRRGAHLIKTVKDPKEIEVYSPPAKED